MAANLARMRPDVAVTTAPYISRSLSHATRALSAALLLVLVVGALGYMNVWLPGPLQLVADYCALSFFSVYLALQAVGALSSSGAFELVDLDTGRVLYSKLRSGKMPRLQDLVAQLATEKEEENDRRC